MPAILFLLWCTEPARVSRARLVTLAQVNAFTPQIGSKAQLRSVISYDHYYPSFHFCRPDHEPQQQSESLGSILAGDRLYDSSFQVRLPPSYELSGGLTDTQIRMLQNETCAKLCDSDIPGEDAKFINERIREDYAYNWLVDGLPAAEMKREQKTGEIFYRYSGLDWHSVLQ
jgi:transmembrane 9 superfamily protein 2/4